MKTDAISPDVHLIDTFSRGDWEGFRDVLTPDVTYEEPATARRTQGADAYVQLCQGWRTALPDGRGTVLRSVRGGDTVVMEVLWEGVHDGPLDTPGGTIAATGRSLSFEGVLWIELQDRRIRHLRHHLDVMTMMRQIGA